MCGLLPRDLKKCNFISLHVLSLIYVFKPDYTLCGIHKWRANLSFMCDNYTVYGTTIDKTRAHHSVNNFWHDGTSFLIGTE